MITIEREYAALKATPYYNLKTNILTGEPAQAKEPDPDTIARLQKSLDVNESQARAISCSNNTSGFSLIQGYAFFIPLFVFLFCSLTLFFIFLVLLVLVKRKQFLVLLDLF